jgi:Kef-type K+ transport system membrane component KefB
VLGGAGESLFEFLMQLGIIVLLFRVGLESHLDRLLKQLRSATPIWIGNVVGSWLLGFAGAYFVVGLDLLTSVVAGTALTATSVGVTTAVWQQAGALETPTGERFLDVAELDDISGVVFMALLFTLLPALREGEGSVTALAVGKTIGRFAFILAALWAGCYLFSRYVEERMTSFFAQLKPAGEPIAMVAGSGVLIASLAALAGFSAAIGAFFAGLAFSRDPKRVYLDAAFKPLYELLSPFFFIGVGLAVAPATLGSATGAAALLLAAALAGKLIGAFFPALLCSTPGQAAVIALSMTPRAEISMVIMKQGHQMGKDVVPDNVYSAMVLVSAATCALVPPILYTLIQRTSLQEQGENA